MSETSADKDNKILYLKISPTEAVHQLLVFFEEILRIEVLCERGIIGMILFTFSVTFLQIKIFSLKIVFQNFYFMPQNETIV